MYLLAALLFTKIHFRSVEPKSLATRTGTLISRIASGVSTISAADLTVIHQIIEVLAVAALLFAFRASVSRLMLECSATVWSLLILYPMLLNHCVLAEHRSPSEIPAILFFVLALNCILAGRDLLLCVVFLLGCLNRESHLLVALVALVIRQPQERWTKALLRSAMLIAMWLCVRAYLRGSPWVGSPQPHFGDNLGLTVSALLLDPTTVRYLLAFGGAWLVLPFAWPHLPGQAKRLAWLVVPYGLVALWYARLAHGGSCPELIVPLATVAVLWLHREVDRWPQTRATGCARRMPLTWVIVCAAVACSCVLIHERATLDNLAFDRSRVAVALGSAIRPFQYRILVPFMARQLWQSLGATLTGWMNVIDAIFVCALLIAFRAYLHPCVGRRASYPLCFLILVPILWNYCALNDYYYASDLPAIAFFVIGALCMRRGRWWAYYAVFILATLNRETSCFLTVLLVCTQWPRRRWPVLMGHCLGQLAIWIGVKLLLARAFATNPGAAVVEVHLWQNLEQIGELLTFDLARLQYLLAFGLAWAVIPFVWQDLPPFSRRACLVAIPYLVSVAIAGCVFEVRVHAELVPILTIPAAFWLHRRNAS